MKSIIELFRTKLPFRVDTGGIFIYARHALRNEIDFNVFMPTIGKNLQRGLEWSLDQKRELIYSLFKGIKLPPFYVIIHTKKNDEQIYQIIDGKQRLTTILSFLKDEFTILADGKEYLFSQLDSQAQDAVALYSIQGYIAYSDRHNTILDKDKFEWFKQINFAGTPQDINHLRSIENELKNK